VDFDQNDKIDTSHIEDRRGSGRGGQVAAGAGGLGIIGIVIALLTTVLGGGGSGGIGGIDIGAVLEQMQVGAVPSQGAAATPAVGTSCAAVTSASDNGTFIACVENNVQTFWQSTFAAARETYSPAKLVLFTSATASSCGTASAQTGPFYCPPDQKVYLDLAFFQQLRTQFGGPNSDFAQAYVVAHEYAHHIQTLLGIEGQMRSAQEATPSKANELSTRLELQADCFAGVWGHAAFASGKVTTTEVGDALAAAASVGDDRIQKSSGQRVNPETFTHGSAKQRQTWFSKGFDTGDPDQCDTFANAI
jgi:predicted metalloprotease